MTTFTGRVLALDISTSAGYAVLDRPWPNDPSTLVAKGTLANDKTIDGYGTYPFNYFEAANLMALKLQMTIAEYEPDIIVIEETNKGKNRYSQKVLEFIHCLLLDRLVHTKYQDRVFYVNTSDWRKKIGVELTKEEKKQNSKLSRAKSKAGGSLTYTEKKTLGIRGKINKKHVAIRVVNAKFNLGLKSKDDDIADAICQGLAYIAGVETCDGKPGKKRSNKSS